MMSAKLDEIEARLAAYETDGRWVGIRHDLTGLHEHAPDDLRALLAVAKAVESYVEAAKFVSVAPDLMPLVNALKALDNPPELPYIDSIASACNGTHGQYRLPEYERWQVSPITWCQGVSKLMTGWVRSPTIGTRIVSAFSHSANSYCSDFRSWCTTTRVPGRG